MAPYDSPIVPRKMVNGILDEIRLSSIARSAQWIATEYANQGSPSTFFSSGNEESSGSSCTLPASFTPCSWGYRKKITIDKTKVSGTNPLSDFPVLVNLTLETPAHAQANGEDFVFTASDGTSKLSHEIESYSGGTGVLTAWVKVPSVSPSANTDLYLYYGNPSTSSQEDPHGTWSNGYRGVWHHDHNLLDSTFNGNDGTTGGTTNTGGKIGRAQDYGDNDYVDVGSGSSLDSVFAGGGTVSAWIYPHTWGWASFGRVADKTFDTSNGGGWAFMVDGSGTQSFNRSLRFVRAFSTQVGGWEVSPNDSIELNKWQYVVVTYDETSLTNDPLLFINGSSKAVTETKNPTGSVSLDDAQVMRIGNYGGGTSRSFDGIIDEIRISHVIRSAGWIQTEYNNQNNPGSFFASIGAEEGACGTTPQTISFSPCNWQYRKKITINGTMVAGTQTNFPILVNLSSDSDLGTYAQDSGYDLVFTQSDGTTQLSHEIESFSGTTGALLAWVKVPSISSSVNTDIYLYFGNQTSLNQQNATGVWSNGFVSVWHLKEGTGVTVADSTNTNNGTPQNSPTQVTGKVDGSLNFDGSGQCVQAADYDILNAITFSEWLKADTTLDSAGIVSKRTDVEPAGDWAMRLDESETG
ncbi:MAG: DUF2341 domain-containing protein, partial [Methanomicrobiales archaeon]|nr:DUF2341 domain-containing protein [Methanomicrobiales archaeon]